MNEDENVNGNLGSDQVNGKELEKEERNDINGDGETLISDVDHINLQGEEEEKRLIQLGRRSLITNHLIIYLSCIKNIPEIIFWI